MTINLERSWECGRCKRRMEKPGRHLRPGSFVPCFEEMRVMKTFADHKEYTVDQVQWVEHSGRLPAPSLKVNHVDGPAIVFSDGQMHWLGLWDRLILALGLTDAELLQWKHRPNLCAAFGVKRSAPRVKFDYGPDYRYFDTRTRLSFGWGKRFGFFDRREGEMVYAHWVDISWPRLIRIDWQ